MKYAMKYYKGCQKNVDELIIIWHEDDTEEGLNKFKEENPNTRIIIDIRGFDKNFIEEKIFPITANKDFTFLLDFHTQFQTSVDIIIKEIGKYFFADNVTDMTTLRHFITLGVSDVYITEDLGFNLKEVSELCKNASIQVRCYPNIAQHPDNDENENTFWSFFIRPEDECFFSKYVDVYEFKGPINKQSILLDIYRGHKWDGDLRQLILGLTQSVKSYCIPPVWGEARAHCKHKCDNCKVCENVLSLAQTMEDHNIMIKLDYGQDLTNNYIQQIKDDIALRNNGTVEK